MPYQPTESLSCYPASTIGIPNSTTRFWYLPSSGKFERTAISIRRQRYPRRS